MDHPRGGEVISAPSDAAKRLSVVVVSWSRPDSVRSCLDHLSRLDRLPEEVVIVDASPDDRTAAVVDAYPFARRIAFAGGAGHMTTSRNVGLLHVSGAVIAFIDDDVNVRSGWSQALLETFAMHPKAGAVVGRTCNGLPDEEAEGVALIGRMLPNGDLTGYFAADPGATIEVDHGIGANMSFRSEVLGALGGFRDDFVGVGVREDTDMFLRVRALGHTVVFCPAAVVDHMGAPHVTGRRFDYRYVLTSRRNHALLLARNYGLGSARFRRWILRETGRVFGAKAESWLRRLVRVGLGIAGIAYGIGVSVQKAGLSGSEPMRRDSVGEEIRNRLSRRH